jgi:hypothetical protein
MGGMEMIYVCCSCHKMIDHTEFESKTRKVMPQYFIPFGAIGWLSGTYVCPKCSYENAGYELKTYEEYVGFKLYTITWRDGTINEFRGLNLQDSLIRAGYSLNVIDNIKLFRETKESV